MGLLKKLAGFLGFGHESKDVVVQDNAAAAAEAQNVQRRGFSVPIQVPIERPAHSLGPVIVPCTCSSSLDGDGDGDGDGYGYGGVQGLRWYAKRLRIDEDGDVADEFLDEILSDKPTSTDGQHMQYPKFKLKYSTKTAKVTSQALSAASGKILHRVEHQGRLEWI